MLNGALVYKRFGQYGALWLGALMLALGLIGGGRLLTHAPLAQVADAVLPVLFLLLTAALAAFAILTLAARETAATKAVLIVGGALLALPLLWAPVLGAVAAAAIAGAAIEYSRAYAQFRIAVSHLIFPLVQAATGGAALRTAWAVFQGLATVVGFVSALTNVWGVLRRGLQGPSASAPQ